MLDNTTNTISTFRAKIGFKRMMTLMELIARIVNLCNYCDPYILVNGTKTITGAGAYTKARLPDERNKQVILKNCAPLINTQVRNVKDIAKMMPIYNLIEYIDNYSKTSRNLQHYQRYDPNDNMRDSESSIFKIK